MDMSFSFGDAVPIAAPDLRYSELLALVRDENGIVVSANEAVLANARAAAPLDCTRATTMLTDVLLGRPGWREATLALGGRFASEHNVAAASERSRKPV